MIFNVRGLSWRVLLGCVLTSACTQLFTFDEFTFDAAPATNDLSSLDRTAPDDIATDLTTQDRAEPDRVAIDAPSPDGSTPDTQAPDVATPDASEMDRPTTFDAPDAVISDELPGARDVLVVDVPEEAIDVVLPDGALCPLGLNSCDGLCVDLAADPTNCGRCDNACDSTHADARCIEGACSPVCHAGFANCDGEPANGCETDLSEREHCLACTTVCGNDRVCDATRGCVCPTGQSACPSGCHDLQSDPRNCGACGRMCSTSNVCQGGLCTGACPSGTRDCMHACVNVTNDLQHCGACDHPCSNEHGTTTCAFGVCAPVCATGWSDCDGNPSNGCETDIFSNEHCGTCDRECTADQTCPAGACVRRCAAGQIDCGGACFNRSTSHEHCGRCDISCNGTQRCVNAVCRACYNEYTYCTPTVTFCCGTLVCGPVTVPAVHNACCRPRGTACGVGSLCCAGGACVNGHCT